MPMKLWYLFVRAASSTLTKMNILFVGEENSDFCFPLSNIYVY